MPERTAFVLAGGGSLGAVEVGMLEVLVERGVEADFVVGASAGAINGVYFACAPDADGVATLAGIWCSLRRGDVFPISLLGSLLGIFSRQNHLVDPGPLRRRIERELPARDLGDTAIPFHAVTTDVLTGEEVVLSEGPAVPAVLASAAIPAVFPPVEIGGRFLVDGGVSNNTPISVAVGLGAGRVIVLPTGTSCDIERPPEGALEMALHGLSLLIARQLCVDVERFRDRVKLRVVPPLCPVEAHLADFSRTGELIERAAESTRAWLADGGLERAAIPEHMLPHSH